MGDHRNRNETTAIVITPEMIDAGVKAFALWDPREDRISWIFEDVFEEMMKVAIKQKQA